MTSNDLQPGDALPPPTHEEAMSRYGRFRGEVLAGGAVTERPPDEPFGGGPGGLIAGLGILALLVWLGISNMWMFVFVVGILVSVFLHELGHYLTARLTGMKVTQFFLGFGPRLWSFHRGETEYGVRLLPLGAFVRIIGMNNLDTVEPADEGRTYRQKSFPRRLLVISAGSLMHMVIAIVLFFGVFAIKGDVDTGAGAEVRAVVAGQPAAAAGLQAGDVVLTVGDIDIVDGDLGAAVRQFEPGDEVDVEFLRGGEAHTVTVALGSNPGIDTDLYEGSAFLGLSPRAVVEWQSMSIGEAAGRSVTDLFPTSWESTKGIINVLNPVNIFEHLTDDADAELTTRPTTLVGATDVSGDIGADLGLGGVIYLLAALNVFVGVFNMFPLLPLDGGHAAIAVYERIREIGRRGRYFTDVSKLMPLTMGVIALLLFLFMSGLYLDLTRPL